MTAHRKDFDATKEYSVNVSGCTEEEKKEVQQAFFDAGFRWKIKYKDYGHLNAVQYTNTTGMGEVTTYCMHGSTTDDGNMTAEEFIGLVYEQGHTHARLMAQYAEDAKTTDKPWDLYQIKTVQNIWKDIGCQFIFDSNCTYRRKPKTHTVNGVEIPDLRFTPKTYEEYYFPSPNHPSLAFRTRANYAHFNAADEHRIKNGLCYEISEEGSQAAKLHSKAMLGIVT